MLAELYTFWVVARPSQVKNYLDGLTSRDHQAQVREWVRSKGYKVHQGECGRLVDQPYWVLVADPGKPSVVTGVHRPERIDLVWREAALGAVARLPGTLLRHLADKDLPQALSDNVDGDGGLRERYEELVREVALAVDRVERLLGTQDQPEAR